MQIKYTIFRASLGDAWDDVREAAEALAHITASKLSAAFPTAVVQVDVDLKAKGYEQGVEVLTADGQVDDSAQAVAGRIIEQTWDHFCDYGQDVVSEFRTSRQNLTR